MINSIVAARRDPCVQPHDLHGGRGAPARPREQPEEEEDQRDSSAAATRTAAAAEEGQEGGSCQRSWATVKGVNRFSTVD